MTSPYNDASPGLRDLGFRVLPLIPPSAPHGGRGKAPGEFVQGGWRGMPKWQRFRDVAPSAFELGMWAKYPDANLGIVMGTPVGADLHVVALDFDATDADDLAALLSAAPASPMVKRGQKGETRHFLAAKDFKTRSYDGPRGRLLDVLTGFDCRQTVAPPSIHPVTLKPYEWTRGPVKASDLPVITEDDLSVIEEALETMGWVRGGASRPKREVDLSALPDSDDFFTETKVAALANMEAWVFDLDVYDLRPARGGYEAVATWRPSSTGKPIAERKRNLSIQVAGIKDFGTGWTGSAIDLVMEAQDLDQAAATSWLRMRLGLTGEVMLLDQQPRAAAGASPTFTPALPAVITEAAPALRGADTRPVAAPASAVLDGELPDRLTSVPGLVGMITDWITDTAERPQRGLALGAALALVGTAAGRKFGGPTNSGTHLYILALAPTAAGKDHPLASIGVILDASGMAACNGPCSFMSMQAAIRTLREQPRCVCAMDEFGSVLAKINNKSAMNHEKAISGVWRQAWGSSFKSFTTPAYAQTSSERVVAPAMSIYGASTPEEFFAAVAGGDIFNGFLNRFVILSTTVRPPRRGPIRDVFEVPAEIIQAMVSINEAGGALLGATMHSGSAGRPEIKVPWAEDQAGRVYSRLGEEIEAREADAELLARTQEMAVRFATIRAIGIRPDRPEITVEDMEWGRDLAMWSAERMISDAHDFMSETENQARAMTLLRTIKTKGPRVEWRVIQQSNRHKIKLVELAATLADLVAQGDVRCDLGDRPETGGSQKRYYSIC